MKYELKLEIRGTYHFTLRGPTKVLTESLDKIKRSLCQTMPKKSMPKKSMTKQLELTNFDFFFSLFIPDARFFASSSSTYYSDKRQIAATQFWHFWYNQTLFSNRPNDPWSSIPRGGGHVFESPPTIGWNYRTDSQFSVEESVATPVYVQASYGKGSTKCTVI